MWDHHEALSLSYGSRDTCLGALVGACEVAAEIMKWQDGVRGSSSTYIQ
jgi:hypothetical protein